MRLKLILRNLIFQGMVGLVFPVFSVLKIVYKLIFQMFDIMEGILLFSGNVLLIINVISITVLSEINDPQYESV